ncbi:hypothetical protein LJ737_22560 [Hymenobacter sp. 15J16-1T3B]|uniref:hypothetical protein n=1 Tax=Hymenobacter sp. 15J16-1T3B TaxID=2886941 RepID=UPI001D107DB3|nr:hypothetical protein [Hymenobacter sp. 15J16-1T3B]MCC3160037.1 hypothetical protein [Hymenobacter sp. 15J16-1T3B]
MAYPPVHIVNSTPGSVSGTVTYPSFFCSDDNYSIPFNGQPWQAGGRGVCLVTKITATVVVGGQSFEAVPYTSSGTSYSQFAVIQTGVNAFAVTRVTTEVGDAGDSVDVGELLAEPTAQQK